MRTGYASNYVTEPCAEIVVISQLMFEGKCVNRFSCAQRVASGWPTARYSHQLTSELKYRTGFTGGKPLLTGSRCCLLVMSSQGGEHETGLQALTESAKG